MVTDDAFAAAVGLAAVSCLAISCAMLCSRFGGDCPNLCGRRVSGRRRHSPRKPRRGHRANASATRSAFEATPLLVTEAQAEEAAVGSPGQHERRYGDDGRARDNEQGSAGEVDGTHSCEAALGGRAPAPPRMKLWGFGDETSRLWEPEQLEQGRWGSVKVLPAVAPTPSAVLSGLVRTPSGTCITQLSITEGSVDRSGRDTTYLSVAL